MLRVQDRLTVRQSTFTRLATHAGQSGPGGAKPNKSLNLVGALATVAPRASPPDTQARKTVQQTDGATASIETPRVASGPSRTTRQLEATDVRAPTRPSAGDLLDRADAIQEPAKGGHTEGRLAMAVLDPSLAMDLVESSDKMGPASDLNTSSDKVGSTADPMVGSDMLGSAPVPLSRWRIAR